MSLSRKEINPLDVLGSRRLSFIPEHFSKLTVENKVDFTLLDQWIGYNLNGRYSLIRSVALDSEHVISEVIKIGLEDPKEIVILSLGCPLLHKK